MQGLITELLFATADVRGFITWALAFVVAAFCFFPSRVVLGAAGFVFGMWSIPGAYAVAVLTAMLQFFAGRVLIGRWSARLIGKYRVLRISDQVIAENGWQTTALLRFAPIPFGLQNYCLSFSTIHVRAFALGTILGLICPIILWTSIGVIGRQLVVGSIEAWQVGVMLMGFLPMLLIAPRLRGRYRDLITATDP